MPKVALVKCSSYNTEEIYQKVQSLIDLLGGIKSFIRSGQKVLIKPNILAPFKIERAATTHPAMVEAAILLVKQSGGKPYVGESPGAGSAEYCAKAAGILDICKKHRVRFVDLKTPVEVENPQGQRFKKIYIAKEIDEFDAIINVPKWKTHGLTSITGAVKNLYGCVPGLLKSQYHYKIRTRPEFCELIIDIYRFFKEKVKLCILDGVVAMEGEGPSAGNPYPLGLIGISTDQMAVDQVFSEICGIDPKSVPIIEYQKDIEVIGEKIRAPGFKYYESLPEGVLHLGLLGQILNIFFREKPVILENKCTKCATCVMVCASRAILNEMKIDYGKCVRCFCCAEFCPEKAIIIKRNPAIHFINRLLQSLPIPG